MSTIPEQPTDESTLTARWERAFDRIATPFEEFIHNQTSSGLILMAATALALLLANSPFAPIYHHLLHTSIGFQIGGWELEKTLHHWINDGLMALFFFLVGLEIKREILAGELTSLRKAALPIIAAIGGMVVPATIYLLMVLLLGGDATALRGWAVPMATDIAFAVGVLVLLGQRVPMALMMFLVALAIVDDLGAVLIIALFYSDTILIEALLAVALLFALLLLLNLLGIRRPGPYFFLGILLWLAMLKSGVHATLAGVLVAITIPARPKYDPRRFCALVSELMTRFSSSCERDPNPLRNEQQKSLLQALENGIFNIQTPLQQLEHRLHLPVGLVIVPLFALANAGIPIAFDQLDALLLNPTTLSVSGGLLIGKFIGIFGATWLALRLNIAQLPQGVSLNHIAGVGFLGGIGFTMSIFIAELAFSHQPEALLAAKSGILLTSMIAGVTGYLWLRRLPPAQHNRA